MLYLTYNSSHNHRPGLKISELKHVIRLSKRSSLLNSSPFTLTIAVEQEVFGLEISVYDIPGMQIFKSHKDLHTHAHRHPNQNHVTQKASRNSGTLHMRARSISISLYLTTAKQISMRYTSLSLLPPPLPLSLTSSCDAKSLAVLLGLLAVVYLVLVTWH
jgi:hypothetical protein